MGGKGEKSEKGEEVRGKVKEKVDKETVAENREGRGVCILWERRALCYVHLSL